MSSAAKQDYSRTAFTEEIIKDALLTLLKKKNYMDITITDICRQACISRGTFYSHFRTSVRLLICFLMMHLSKSETSRFRHSAIHWITVTKDSLCAAFSGKTKGTSHCSFQISCISMPFNAQWLHCEKVFYQS